MNDLLYVVFKVAVYRHECGGVFLTLDKARQAAEELREGEKDDHHSYEIVAFELDKKTEQTPLIEKVGYQGRKYFTGGDLIEADVIQDVGRKSV